MKTLTRTLSLAALLLLCPHPARAQVSVHIDLGLPVVPRLVVVQPGIQVVEDFQDEVFFHSGWYWCRRPDGWYRSRSPRAHFYGIAPHRVPPPLIRMPEGRYRHWRHDGARPLERPGHRRHYVKPQHERRDERRERREEKREERRDRRDDDRGRWNHGGPRHEEGRGHR